MPDDPAATSCCPSRGLSRAATRRFHGNTVNATLSAGTTTKHYQQGCHERQPLLPPALDTFVYFLFRFDPAATVVAPDRLSLGATQLLPPVEATRRYSIIDLVQPCMERDVVEPLLFDHFQGSVRSSRADRHRIFYCASTRTWLYPSKPSSIPFRGVRQRRTDSDRSSPT